MKSIHLSVLIISLLQACATLDIDTEKEAIKAVIEKETKAYLGKDIISRSETFLNDESVIVLVAGQDKYGYAVGYKQIMEGQKKQIAKNPTASTHKFRNENYRIKVYDKCAWAVYDELLYNKDGEFIEKVINSRFLDKENGKWKIVYLSHVNTTSYE